MDIYQGAEAKLRMIDGRVEKDRFCKGYRHAELDRRLRRSRTRREGKVLLKMAEIGVSAPSLVSVDDKEMKVDMSHVEGEMVKDYLEKHEKDLDSLKRVCVEIGRMLSKMHNNTIIHQDLTTSNMIIDKGKISFIDFGLSFFSTKDEDKAVDIHLFKQALESKHHRSATICFEAFLEGYKQSPCSLAVLKRFLKVESRGRNKGKC